MEVSRPLRIFLADDHAVVLSGLRALLADEADMEVIGDASTTRETLSKVRDLRPDLVMLDIRFGDNEDAGGIDTCRRIRSELPGTRVVMFTSYGDRESVLASVLAGADAFFTKNMGRGPLLESIRAVGRGELLLDSRVTRDVVERLARCVDLGRAGRPAVDLEITESGIIDIGPRSIALMNELRAAGFSLSIDDFGTGYSSLAYLSQFPVECLKIDRSFTLALGGDNDSHGIVEAVIAMGRSLGMKVVAEGVETSAQLDALRELGCTYGQGFLMGRPVSVDAAGALLAVQGAGLPTWIRGVFSSSSPRPIMPPL